MAIIGEIFIIIIGFIVLLGGTVCAYGVSKMCGCKGIFAPIITAIIGLAIIFVAVHYGPITITIK